MTDVRAGSEELATQMLALYFRGSGRRPPMEMVASFLRELPSSVAYDREELLGFAFCRPFAPDIVELANLFVEENHRSQGIGRRLVMHLETQLRGKCHSVIVTNSMLVHGVPNKRPADKFYRRLGYSEIWNTGPTLVFCKSIGEDCG